MSSISIIIPIHKFNDLYKNLLGNALTSINTDLDVEIAFVGPKDVMDEVKTCDFLPVIPIRYIDNDICDYCSSVNLAVSKISSPYFSVLEVDDAYTKNWFNNVEKYIEAKPNVSMFLPLTTQHDIAKEGVNFVGFMNEIVWAQGFSENAGYLSHDGLMNYYDYNVSGAIIRTEDFIKAGKLKPSIKIFFWYEFLLRFVDKGNTIYVIPKIGYQHSVNREDSLMSYYNENVSKEEAEFWLQTAQEEYFFERDREKKYEA